jgi:hypothetical protein
MIKNQKNNQYQNILFVFAVLLIINPVSASAQNTSLGERVLEVLNVFLECPDCDPLYIRDNIPFIRLVEAREQAHVQIRMTRIREEGREAYQIQFTGNRRFQGDDDVLIFRTGPAESEEEEKQRLAHTMEMGLMRYAGKTGIAERVSVTFQDEVEPTAVEDKWDFWVFSISANTFLDGEKLYKSNMIFGSVSASRVTPDLKVNLRASAHYNRSEYTFGGQTIESKSDSKNFSGLIVKSISGHWSVGGYLSAGSSIYNNTEFSLTPAPAVEYNVFPYSESTRRQLRFLYRLGFNTVNYMEETIFLKTRENLWSESLAVIFELKKSWGTLGASLAGSHYFHDFGKNRLTLNGDISLRLVKGLSLSLNGRYSRIRDQLFLPRAEASLEETLLRVKQLQTGYSYYISVGLNFTFGSTQSKVVNPRFGDGGASISISF